MLNQKDNHNNTFNYITNHLFQNTKYPVVHFASKKPLGLRKVSMDDQEKQVRILTFHGISAYGIPKFPTNIY